MGFPVNVPSQSPPKPLNFLIYGKTGWIGGLLGKLCQSQSIPFAYGSGRLEDRRSLEADLAAHDPSHVINAAGVTGRPNVDWCESHKVETIRANVVGTLTLADVCRERGLILINYATGCIFEYDAEHPLGSGVGLRRRIRRISSGRFIPRLRPWWKTCSEIMRMSNFTLEEQAQVIVAPRSNNELDATKLSREFPELLSIKESLIKYVFKPNQKTSVA
ncbi:hypothetical protein C3L33_08595, partial [Rhododendron williamsianum]